MNDIPYSPSPEHELLCELKGVSHDFRLPSGNFLPVLDGIDLSVRSREVVAILGPSGCGKSTLLRIIAGLLPPGKGQAFYRGRPQMGLNEDCALVFQTFALFPWMTILENVRTILRAAGLPEPEVRKKASKALRLVGLEGFEGAFPRELSGGMKQRAGIARALSKEPEILLMDEPFSQVDALTAESLRAEVLDIWASVGTNPSAIVLVSHDIKEVVYMADRIVVLSARPGSVRAVVKNDLPRPRDYNSHSFQRLVEYLHETIAGHEMPDLPAASTDPWQAPEPLPRATTGEVVGLLEYLDARGAIENVFRLAADTNRQYGRVITVAKAAEMLGLVDTPRQAVTLTADGQRFVKAAPRERQILWRKAILRLRIFREMHEALKSGRALSQAEALETIVLWMPHENHERIFDTLVQWARYGNLFVFDDQTEILSLPPAGEQDPPA